MRIGFLIHTLGIFGSVREIIEVANVLVDRGHDVTIYHPDGGPCVWLPCKAKIGKADEVTQAGLDALIAVTGWQTDLYDLLMHSNATLKASCLLGFSPTPELADILRGKVPALTRDMRILRDSMRETIVLADSSWQLKWIHETLGIEVGVPFGGIDLGLFMPGPPKKDRAKQRVIASGDPRPRKGLDTVQAAVETLKTKANIEFEVYWNRRFSQAQLVQFLQNGDVFLDGHRRGGWCNPVIEAMACGTAVVCTNIGATSDFALPGITALVVSVDDPTAMANAALRLLKDNALRERLVLNGLDHVQKFSYKNVVPKLETFLTHKLQERVALQCHQ